jgi:large subunit ribosomal protein L17
MRGDRWVRGDERYVRDDGLTLHDASIASLLSIQHPFYTTLSDDPSSVPIPYTLCSEGSVHNMKKRIAFRKLGRTTSHRWAMFRNMLTDLILHERIVTTTPKAKEVQRLADKLITSAKNKDPLHARRQINQIVRTADMQTKLMTVLGPRYQHRQGGYTRILKLAAPRAGDKADMAVLEYIDRPGEVRAARPPGRLQDLESLQQVLQELGISDAIQNAAANDAANDADAKANAALDDLNAKAL